jgi:hypothetical protein
MALLLRMISHCFRAGYCPGLPAYFDSQRPQYLSILFDLLVPVIVMYINDAHNSYRKELLMPNQGTVQPGRCNAAGGC